MWRGLHARTSLSGRVLLEAARGWKDTTLGGGLMTCDTCWPCNQQTRTRSYRRHKIRRDPYNLCAAIMKYGAFYVVISRWSGLQDKANSCFLEIHVCQLRLGVGVFILGGELHYLLIAAHTYGLILIHPEQTYFFHLLHLMCNITSVVSW